MNLYALASYFMMDLRTTKKKIFSLGILDKQCLNSTEELILQQDT